MFKIAFRNIFRQKRRTVLTILMMFGGFTLSAISIGWSDGAYSNIIDLFTRNRLGHIQIHRTGYLDKPSIYDTISDYGQIGNKAKEVKRVVAWAPRLYSAGLCSVEDKSAGAQIIGLDPERERQATNFDKKITAGRYFSHEQERQVLLGIGIAKILNAEPGQKIVIVSQAADGSIANDIYTISGLVDMDDEVTNRTAFYMDIREAQELLVLPNQAHELIFIVNNIKQVRELAVEIAGRIGNTALSVQPWQKFAKSFYEAMKADQEGMWISLFVIILIVAVGVLNTVLMSVLERTREYGLLKALGTDPKQIFVLVLYEVNILSIISIILGCIAGVLANYLLSIYGLKLPTEFTYGGMKFGKMYAEVNARCLYIPALTILFSSALVSVFPAIRAARIDPAKAMRTH